MVEIIGLQSARGRLLFFVVITSAVFLAPYHLLGNLSLWQALNIPSPSIGLTRAYHLLLHGDIHGAWQRNKLIFTILAVGLVILARDLLTITKDYQSQKRKTV